MQTQVMNNTKTTSKCCKPLKKKKTLMHKSRFECYKPLTHLIESNSKSLLLHQAQVSGKTCCCHKPKFECYKP